eukprot:scaffold4402_cov324-Alexandrium_tamarense.AAC.1
MVLESSNRSHREWIVRICPSGSNSGEDGWVSIFLHHCSSECSVKVAYNFMVTDMHGIEARQTSLQTVRVTDPILVTSCYLFLTCSNNST